jgi:23S rRNA pseudouridine2604 synthase
MSEAISLNKYISDSGYCSRRQADEYIEQCRVTINGKDAHKGSRVNDGDEVRVDGEKIKKQQQTVYIALHKPKGITCTTDISDKTNIVSYVNYKQRIFPIGRLDKLSEGLIFLTNDGNIVNKILRAGNGHEKEYIVTTDKPIDLAFLQAMRSGVKILGTKTKPCFVKQEGPNKFKIILTQGLNRQIRRMCETLGFKVTSLVRIRIMGFTIKNIAYGKWRFFTADEVAKLQEMVKDSKNSAGEDEGMGE